MQIQGKPPLSFAFSERGWCLFPYGSAGTGVESDTYKTQGTYLSKTLTVPLGHWDAGWSAQSIILNRISLPLYISDSVTISYE